MAFCEIFEREMGERENVWIRCCAVLIINMQLVWIPDIGEKCLTDCDYHKWKVKFPNQRVSNQITHEPMQNNDEIHDVIADANNEICFMFRSGCYYRFFQPHDHLHDRYRTLHPHIIPILISYIQGLSLTKRWGKMILNI